MWCLSVVCVPSVIQDFQVVNHVATLLGFTLKGLKLLNLGFVLIDFVCFCIDTMLVYLDIS